MYDVLDEYIVPILNVSLQRLLISFVLLFAFFLFRKIIVKIIYGIAKRFTSKTKSTFDDDLLESFKKPVKFLVTTIGIYIVLKYLNTSLIKEITLSRILRASIVGAIGWGLYNLEGAFTIINKFLGNKLNIQENSILYPLLSKFLRIITLLITFGTIAAEFDYPIDTFVTGLGISGLAIALATQDSLANIFGGVTLLIDKPFRIGDWISFGSIEGVVEDISLRSIRIRTFEKALVTIPNSKLSNDSITNFSKRGSRRVRFNLGVTYSTSTEMLQKLINKIEEVLKNNSDITDESPIVVKFDGFGDSSLDILIQFFTSTSDFEEFLRIKQDINFEILSICGNLGVEIAFPSTTVYLENNN